MLLHPNRLHGDTACKGDSSSEREDYYVNLLGASAVFRMKNDRHLVATTVKHISTAKPSIVHHSSCSHYISTVWSP